MKKNNLKKFFNPKTIAIIGASNNSKKVGGILMQKTSKFKGKVIPINPNQEWIFNKKAYKSVLDYNKKIDLAIIAIPAKFILGILKQCGKKKIKNIIIISAGFAEQGNNKLEKKLIKIAKNNSINILGPNCFGIANPYLKLDLTFSNNSPSKGSIAFISQSGALASYVFDLKNSKLSGFVSLGNASDLSFVEWINYFAKDKKTKKIILYVEKIKNGKEFINACKRCNKEIKVIKAGKTEKGSQAAISHTGSIATDYAIYKGAFKQSKIKIIENIFKPIKKELKQFKGKKVLILTNAGGAGALMSDAVSENNYNLIKEPIDILGDADSKNYKKALDKIKKINFDILIIILTPQTMSEPEKTAKEITKFSKKKKVLACFLGEKSIKKAIPILKKSNIKVLENTNKIENILGTKFS